MNAVETDVLVVGAGPAGATAALNLAPLRGVLLLHRPAPPVPRIGESLTGAAGRLLADMGLLPAFLAQGHAPYFANRAVWGGAEAFETDFLRDPNGHGWHLDRARFDAWLLDEAVARGATVRTVARIVEATYDGELWHVRAEGEQGVLTVHARAVIDAGGRAAPIARRLGGRRRALDRLVCVWNSGAASGEGAGVTFLEAEQGGWWYTAPLPGGRRVLAFHTDSDLLDLRVGEGSGALVARAGAHRALASVLEGCGFEPRGKMAVSVAHGGVLEPCAGPGWLAVGDAAMSFDPLSAQGIFNALYTGLAGAEAVDRYLSGDGEGVAGYAETVRGVQAAYQTGLAHWYGMERRFADAPFWRRRVAVG